LVDGQVDAVDGLHFAKVTNEVFGDDWCVVHPDSLAEWISNRRYWSADSAVQCAPPSDSAAVRLR
jgi:hypothetical protein